MRLGNKTIQVLAQLLEKSMISIYDNMENFLRGYDYSSTVKSKFDSEHHFPAGMMPPEVHRGWGKIILLEIYEESFGFHMHRAPIDFDEFTFKLAEDLLNEITSDQFNVLDIQYPLYVRDADIKRFLRFLELDGYAYKSNKIIPLDFDPAESKQITNEVVQKINNNSELNSKVLLYELEQCEENYAKGKGHWKDCIGNSRNFVEQLLEDIAKSASKARGNSTDLSKPVKVREYLLKSGFFDKDEKEKLVDGIYGYFSERGSHPGIPDDKATRIARNVMLNFGFHLLEKFETWKNNSFNTL